MIWWEFRRRPIWHFQCKPPPLNITAVPMRPNRFPILLARASGFPLRDSGAKDADRIHRVVG